MRNHILALLAAVVLPILTGVYAAGSLSSSDDSPLSVLARGPIHEAYAQPYEPVPRPGSIVPRQPPAAIPEAPPDQKPEGENVQWLPGYWAWDADRNDYVWVSGFWRVMPPGQKWVPGYWRQGEEGWQWVPGSWMSADLDQPPLLDPPPPSLENGPAIPAPDEDSTYVPGCWVFRTERFLWRPGYWRPCRTGWVWTPAHYCWTPGGYFFVEGYWDRCLEERGVLFAPVAFEQPLWTQPGWCYQPQYVVPISAPFFSAFFVRPQDCHYFFGDYYPATCLRRGFLPWYAYARRCHDPLFSYYSWHQRHNPRWYHGLRETYLARSQGDSPRPPHTLREQTAWLRHPSHSPRSLAMPVVTPLNSLHGSKVRLTPLMPAQRTAQQAEAKNLRQRSLQRAQMERAGHTERVYARPGVTTSAQQFPTPFTRTQPGAEGIPGSVPRRDTQRPGPTFAPSRPPSPSHALERPSPGNRHGRDSSGPPQVGRPSPPTSEIPAIAPRPPSSSRKKPAEPLIGNRPSSPSRILPPRSSPPASRPPVSAPTFTTPPSRLAPLPPPASRSMPLPPATQPRPPRWSPPSSRPPTPSHTFTTPPARLAPPPPSISRSMPAPVTAPRHVAPPSSRGQSPSGHGGHHRGR